MSRTLRMTGLMAAVLVLAASAAGCFSDGGGDQDAAIEPACTDCGGYEGLPYMDLTRLKREGDSLTDEAGRKVWSLTRPPGSQIEIAGDGALLFAGQSSPAFAALWKEEDFGEINYVFEVSFQVSGLGAANRPMVMLIPRTQSFENGEYYAIQYVLEGGRLRWELINTAAPESFNASNAAARQAPYVLKWGRTYTAWLMVRSISNAMVNIQFYLHDPDNPDTVKEPLINYADTTAYRITRTDGVAAQVGASGTGNIQPAVLYSGMRLLQLGEWEAMKEDGQLVPAAEQMPLSLEAILGGSGAETAESRELALPSIFSSGMVVQQNQPIPVWGTGRSGDRIAVGLAGQLAETTVVDGSWRVDLEPVPAGGPYTLTVQDGRERLEFEDVLAGEVWLLGGQSNMAWTMQRLGEPEHIREADYPALRLFTFSTNMLEEPAWELPGGRWEAAAPASVSAFPAAGYYFGLELHKTHDVPVGLIATSVGGTDIRMWLSGEVARQLEPEPDPSRQRPSYLFNARIAPLVSYGIAGAAWWQGEHNASNRDRNYTDMFTALIEDWRKRWGQGSFPFLFVQLSSYRDPTFPVLREQQLMALLQTENTGMAVTIDNGELNDIHPRNKQEAGHRLFLLAEALAYGKPVVHMGPIYRSMEIRGDAIALQFDHTGSGLVAKGDTLQGFMISGPDQQFVDAGARIEGDEVIVRSGRVASPVAVRYAYQGYPAANLYNREGLPASPFRTDRFEE